MANQESDVSTGVDLTYHFDKTIPVNTKRRIHAHGKQFEAKERLLKAYFTKGIWTTMKY